MVFERRYIDTNAVLHNTMLRYWSLEAEKWRKESRMVRPVMDRLAEAQEQQHCDGDVIVGQVRDMFYHGLGNRYTPVQKRIFEALLFSCLPLIYGDTWGENMTRVLKEWDKPKAHYYNIISMARRHGKTFVVAASAASLLLVCPDMTIAIFSTGLRAAQMMMNVIMDMMQQAFSKGTHATREDYQQLVKNLQISVLRGPDGTKRYLGSYPSSITVRLVLIC